MKKILLYRVVPHNGGVVFAEPERAKFVARMHEAIGSAATWGEFRRAVPRAEYSKIIRAFDDAGERRPRSTDRFEGEVVPGWSDGDYPPWLQLEMADVVPIAMLRQYGTLEETAVNGNFWMIPEDNLRAMCRALRALGYEVEHARALRFW